MGFQIVETDRAYAREPEAWLVFNAELAIAFDNSLEAERWLAGGRNAGTVDWLRGQAIALGQMYRTPRVVVTRSGLGVASSTYGPSRAIAPAPLSLLKQTATTFGTPYRRFSAFRCDRRVAPGTGDLLPGTYATTATDAPQAPSGFAAVGRYALPNVTPAAFLHILESGGGYPVHSGTVAPAYGQSGGGVEVFFPLGVKNSASYSSPRPLPDE
jgi:hypothetical protein